MAVFISDYFGIDFDNYGVFDALLDTDSHYFINITRLKVATTPEFSNSYEKINNYFTDIARLLDAAKSKGTEDKFYRNALRKFEFPEVNGINLGFSKSSHGSAFGKILTERVIADAYDIIKSGTKDPEIFHLVGLFEDDIGPDLLSDMIAGIIKDDIYAFTRRINIEAGITPENYTEETFHDGIVYNEYKKCPLLLLPKEILHELPIAACWDDIESVISKNEAIRAEINQTVGKEWAKYSSTQKKHYLRCQLFENPEKCLRILEYYRNSSAEECDWDRDLDYISEKLFKDIKKLGFGILQHSNDSIDSQNAMRCICDIFKDWVENNRGWDVILNTSEKGREKIVQRLIHLCVKYFIEENDFDLSCESNMGRGPSDIKISRGTDRSICEIKLSSNNQYLHGYHTQIGEYGKAECTDNLFYMFIDLGNPGRLSSIKEEYDKNLDKGIKCPELIIIDSTGKKSASVF